MALIIPWEYLVSGLVVHLVAVILSLPLFFFIPETHEFLHGIFLRIVRTYEILQWCLQLFLLSMKKIICFSCWISRTILVDSVAIPWYVLAELGSVILRRNRQPGGENPEPCQAFNGDSEEGAQDQNGKDLRKVVPHLQEIQVTESSRMLDWQKVDGVKVTRKTDSISFSLNSFAGVRAVVQQPALELYYAMFVKRLNGFPNPTEHLFYILLFSGDRNSQDAASFTLASPENEVVIERQLLVVRPPCAFKACLSIPAISSSSSEVSFEIPVNCSKIHEIQMIKIAKDDCSAAIQPGVSVGLNYKVCSSGSSSSKLYAFYWNAPPVIPLAISISSVNHLTVNANGDRSVGAFFSPEAVMILTDRSPRLCESERGFRDHELPRLFRDNSVPNLLDQDNSNSETDSQCHSSLGVISALDCSIGNIDDSGIGLFMQQSTSLPSPVIHGQELFEREEPYLELPSLDFPLL